MSGKQGSPEKAKHFDDGKNRVELISPLAILGTSSVLTYGSRVKGYGDHNWQKGMEWNKVIGSLLRHTLLFMSGLDIDPESGLLQVDHMGCNISMLQEYARTHKELDDRFKYSPEVIAEMKNLIYGLFPSEKSPL